MQKKINYAERAESLINLAIIVTVVIAAFFIYKAELDTTRPIDSGLWGNFGTVISGTIGPLLSLAGILLLFETLASQSKSYHEQQEAFKKQQIASHFFELLKIQRENSNIVREEILSLLKEFEECFCIVKGFSMKINLGLDD